MASELLQRVQTQLAQLIVLELVHLLSYLYEREGKTWTRTFYVQ